MGFNNLLDKYRKISFSERDKGDRFERLMQAYLMTDPKYSNKLKKVWLWNEFHGKSDLGGGDTGIRAGSSEFIAGEKRQGAYRVCKIEAG